MFTWGSERTTRVEYRCGVEEKIIFIGEISTCRYKIIIATPRLCFDQSFSWLKPGSVQKIVCKLPGNLVSNEPLDLQAALALYEKSKAPVAAKSNLLELPSTEAADLVAEAIVNVLDKIFK